MFPLLSYSLKWKDAESIHISELGTKKRANLKKGHAA